MVARDEILVLQVTQVTADRDHRNPELFGEMGNADFVVGGKDFKDSFVSTVHVCSVAYLFVERISSTFRTFVFSQLIF